MTSRFRCDVLTNWAMKLLTLGAGQFWVQMLLWKIWKWIMHMKEIICEMRIWNQMKNDHRSCDHNLQLRKEAWKIPISVEVLNYFQASLRNCKNWDHNCDDHSSFEFSASLASEQAINISTRTTVYSTWPSITWRLLCLSNRWSRISELQNFASQYH